MNDNIETDDIVSGLTSMEIEKIYRIQYKIYWEEDLIDRCNDRRTEGQGLCNLPDTLEDEKDLLNTAYDLYCKIKDSNIAYNDTLDAVIDEMEQRIANGVPELSLMKAKRKLNVVCTCTSYYTSSIEVPADYTLEQAITYAREHIDEIPIGSGLEYIGGSDELDEEHCEFEKISEGGAG